jgi:hypothetical protein
MRKKDIVKLAVLEAAHWPGCNVQMAFAARSFLSDHKTQQGCRRNYWWVEVEVVVVVAVTVVEARALIASSPASISTLACFVQYIP